ncbi:MAG TPA: hypothetical protein VH877_02790 [Polyangia bacterium]|nr:hypothetical protein [Polyangia bacterium]
MSHFLLRPYQIIVPQQFPGALQMQVQGLFLFVDAHRLALRLGATGGP